MTYWVDSVENLISPAALAEVLEAAGYVKTISSCSSDRYTWDGIDLITAIMWLPNDGIRWDYVPAYFYRLWSLPGLPVDSLYTAYSLLNRITTTSWAGKPVQASQTVYLETEPIEHDRLVIQQITAFGRQHDWRMNIDARSWQHSCHGTTYVVASYKRDALKAMQSHHYGDAPHAIPSLDSALPDRVSGGHPTGEPC